MTGVKQVDEKKTVDLRQVLVTFSQNLEAKYRSPEALKTSLRRLMDSKKSRNSEDEYHISLEKNIVFLKYFVEEGKALVELMLSNLGDDERFLEADPGLLLSEIEERLRKEAGASHRKIFLDREDDEFADLAAHRKRSGGHYSKKLEFYYEYLMTLRNFMVDFMNVLFAVQREYVIENAGELSAGDVWSHIEMMANYYIGNIRVGEGGEQQEN